MNITTEEKNGIVVLNLIGRMDATTASVFEDICSAKLEEGVPLILVNLEELAYISSAGLRVILMMEKSSRVKKSLIAFCSMQEMVQEVFKISGFNAILRIFPTQGEALQALSPAKL